MDLFNSSLFLILQISPCWIGPWIFRNIYIPGEGSAKLFPWGPKIPEASCCKYLGIIIRSDLSWADQVNYTVQRAWRALHFVTRIVKKGNKNTKSLAYTSLVRPILEYGAACWDSYGECQISALDREQNKAAKFAHHSEGSDWESLAQRRKIARMCALYKAYTAEKAWKPLGDRLQAPSYLIRVDHRWKITARKQRSDIGKYSFVNRSITDWNQQPEGTTGTSHGKIHIFKTRVRKV